MALDQFTAIVLVCGVVLVWYLTGLAYNRRLLGTYWKRIRSELDEFNAHPRIRALQPNSITISADSIGKHLHDATISVILIGRQNPFSFAFSRLRKQPDTISIRADLKANPRSEFELLNRKYPLTSTMLRHAFKDWRQEQIDGTDFIYCWRSLKIDLSTLKGMDGLWRISVRSSSPHLLITLPADSKSETQFAWIRDFDFFMAGCLVSHES